jgi:signal transduction histidine kinase
MDRLQTVLAITNLVILLVVLFATQMLGLNMFYATIFLFAVTPVVYLIIGKLLARTKRTLKSQRNFVSNVTHELNGSIAVMQLDSELALHATDSNYQLGLSKRKSQELIDTLKTDLIGLRNMADIIRNLSIMASYEYKPGQLGFERVNLSSLLERLCEAVSTLADKKNIDINIEIDNKSPVYISGNEVALGQMIMNLLNNAVKYSPNGGAVTASMSTTTDEVIMSIKDSGIGMSGTDMLHMFDPFYRSSDSEVRKEEGYGLGLAIVNEVVKEHKAKIFVKSALKKGTIVSVNFPAFT